MWGASVVFLDPLYFSGEGVTREGSCILYPWPMKIITFSLGVVDWIWGTFTMVGTVGLSVSAAGQENTIDSAFTFHLLCENLLYVHKRELKCGEMLFLLDFSALYNHVVAYRSVRKTFCLSFTAHEGVCWWWYQGTQEKLSVFWPAWCSWVPSGMAETGRPTDCIHFF